MYGYHWLSMVMYGYEWLCMVIIGYVSLSLVINGYVWLCMVINGYVWLFVNEQIDMTNKMGIYNYHHRYIKCIRKNYKSDEFSHNHF